MLYVVLNAYNALGVIDLASGTLVKQIPVENSPRDIVVAGNFAYVSNEGGRVATAGAFTMNGRDNGAILLGAPNMTVCLAGIPVIIVVSGTIPGRYSPSRHAASASRVPSRAWSSVRPRPSGHSDSRGLSDNTRRRIA